MINLEILKTEFYNIDFREKRPGVFKVLLPFFHEDGDMYDIFVEEKDNLIRISDYGLTLMKLSYTFDIDTTHKEDVLQSIISQNRCSLDNGNIFLDVTPQQFVGGIYQFVHTLTKVSTMDIISRESVKSYFYELLNEFVMTKLKDFNIQSNITPLKNTGLVVDYVIPNEKPIYLFAVNDDTKASKVVISCLTFITHQHNYRSLIINEDFHSLSKFNQTQIINTADKQFAHLDDFKDRGIEYLHRELAS